MATPVIFRGIKYPFQKGTTSFPAISEGDDVIKDSLLQLVLTMNGQRIMRPTVGTNALSFVFENNDAVLGNLLRAEIQGVVAKYEPRVQVLDVIVEQKGSEIIITVGYIVLATRRQGSVGISVPLPV